MIWSREIEGGSFDTPERRAALEARIGELASAVRDEVVRRYYRDDLASRRSAPFARKAAAAATRAAISEAVAATESPRRFAPRQRSCAAGLRSGAGKGNVTPALRPAPTRPRAPPRQQPDHARPALGDLPPGGPDPLDLVNYPGCCTTIWKKSPPLSSPSRGHQAPRRHHGRLRAGSSPIPRALRAGRENAGRY